MKTNILFLFILLSCNFCSAQNPEMVIAKASYRLTHKYDTTDINRINTENFIVLLGNSSSHYKSYDRQLQDSAMLLSYKKDGVMAPPSGRRYDSEQIFCYFNEKKMFITTQETLGLFIVERLYPQIDWKILSEKKQINGYMCQKATGSYHGRNYTVWFTAELPFKAGPWKLNGLPGLIIYAKDETERIQFELTSFQNINDSSMRTEWDKKALSLIEWTDYFKLARSAELDPNGFAEQRFGVKVTTSVKPKGVNFLLPRKYINFPLEAINFYTER